MQQRPGFGRQGVRGLAPGLADSRRRDTARPWPCGVRPGGSGVPLPPVARECLTSWASLAGVQPPGSPRAPDLLRGLHDQPELVPLLLLAEVVALLGGGEAALRRQAQLIDVDEPGGVLDPPPGPPRGWRRPRS